MFRNVAAFGAFCAMAFLSPASAQRYQAPADAEQNQVPSNTQQYPSNLQQYQAPSVTNLTGGGLAPASEAVGGGLSQPPGSQYGEYNAPEGGGTSAPSQGVGGGVNDSPYSSYGLNSAAGITGGGLNMVTQGSTNNGAAALAPNGQTYKSLGISGY
jgi:hypothetical protein